MNDYNLETRAHGFVIRAVVSYDNGRGEYPDSLCIDESLVCWEATFDAIPAIARDMMEKSDSLFFNPEEVNDAFSKMIDAAIRSAYADGVAS